MWLMFDYPEILLMDKALWRKFPFQWFHYGTDEHAFNSTASDRKCVLIMWNTWNSCVSACLFFSFFFSFISYFVLKSLRHWVFVNYNWYLVSFILQGIKSFLLNWETLLKYKVFLEHCYCVVEAIRKAPLLPGAKIEENKEYTAVN